MIYYKLCLSGLFIKRCNHPKIRYVLKLQFVQFWECKLLPELVSCSIQWAKQGTEFRFLISQFMTVLPSQWSFTTNVVVFQILTVPIRYEKSFRLSRTNSSPPGQLLYSFPKLTDVAHWPNTLCISLCYIVVYIALYSSVFMRKHLVDSRSLPPVESTAELWRFSVGAACPGGSALWLSNMLEVLCFPGSKLKREGTPAMTLAVALPQVIGGVTSISIEIDVYTYISTECTEA